MSDGSNFTTDELVNLLSDKTANICLSGGADGSDMLWGQCAATLGHFVIHWSFSGHRSLASSNELVRLTPEQLELADDALILANNSLKRFLPFRKPWIINLLRRNYYQVRWSDSLYAVSSFDKKGLVEGGTAWAVQMYMDRFANSKEPLENCNLYLFDQNRDLWLQWRGEWFSINNPPTPKGVWGGVGTREINSSGILAVKSLF